MVRASLLERMEGVEAAVLQMKKCQEAVIVIISNQINVCRHRNDKLAAQKYSVLWRIIAVCADDIFGDVDNEDSADEKNRSSLIP